MTTIATTKDAMAAAKTRMEKAVDDFRKELATLRTGRANASILDNIRVDYHGTPMPVNQLGTVTVPEACSFHVSLSSFSISTFFPSTNASTCCTWLLKSRIS